MNRDFADPYEPDCLFMIYMYDKQISCHIVVYVRWRRKAARWKTLCGSPVGYRPTDEPLASDHRQQNCNKFWHFSKTHTPQKSQTPLFMVQCVAFVHCQYYWHCSSKTSHTRQTIAPVHGGTNHFVHTVKLADGGSGRVKGWVVEAGKLRHMWYRPTPRFVG